MSPRGPPGKCGLRQGSQQATDPHAASTQMDTQGPGPSLCCRAGPLLGAWLSQSPSHPVFITPPFYFPEAATRTIQGRSCLVVMVSEPAGTLAFTMRSPSAQGDPPAPCSPHDLSRERGTPYKMWGSQCHTEDTLLVLPSEPDQGPLSLN